MASWVQIANKALRRLGNAPIQAFSDDSDAARAVNGIYEMVRDGVLSRHPWNCAMVRTTVAADVTTPTFGFDYQFTMPTDPYCLRVWMIGEDYDYQVRYKCEGRKILTDEAGPLYITYISRVTDPEQFSPWLADLLAAELAAELAYTLTASNSKEAAMLEWARRLWQEARTMDGQEGTPDDQVDDDYLRARF